MIPQFMEYITGEQYTVDDLVIIGERIANLRMDLIFGKALSCPILRFLEE